MLLRGQLMELKKKYRKTVNHYQKLKDLDTKLEEFFYKVFITKELDYKFLYIGDLLALPMSIPKLARIFNCSRTPITTWLKKMEAAGYIERRWYKEIHRIKECQIIILTKKGEKFLKDKFQKPPQNLSRGTKKIFLKKISDKKSTNKNYQSKINNFNNNKSIPGAIEHTFQRYNESLCARGWRIFEEITGQHQKATIRGMRFMHCAINELAKGVSAETISDKLNILRQFIRNQCLYLREKTFFNIFSLKAIKIFIKRYWRKIYEFEEQAKSIKDWGHSLFDELKEKYHLKEVNRPRVDNTTILIDNNKEKQTLNWWEAEEMYNSKYRKRARGYTEPLYYEGFNLEARRREVLAAYNAQFGEALTRPNHKQPKINTQDDLEAAKLRYTRLLKNLV